MTRPDEKYKDDIVTAIAQDCGVTKVVAEKVMKSFVKVVGDFLRDGYKVKVTNFFHFEVRDRKARVAKDPRTLELMEIPAHKTVIAKMTAPFKRKIRGEE